MRADVKRHIARTSSGPQIRTSLVSRSRPGEHLVIDRTPVAGWHVFCAVLAWSRWRFVRFACDEKAATTMALLAECFDELGGVPKVVLSDRIAV